MVSLINLEVNRLRILLTSLISPRLNATKDVWWDAGIAEAVVKRRSIVALAHASACVVMHRHSSAVIRFAFESDMGEQPHLLMKIKIPDHRTLEVIGSCPCESVANLLILTPNLEE